MSFFSWDDIDLNAGRIVYGKITLINKYTLTASVEKIGSDIPIHYHCDQDGTSNDGRRWEDVYPDDLDKKGGQAFHVGDEVAVMFRGVKDTKPVIIGFRGEAMPCVPYLLYITSGDAVTLFDLAENEVYQMEDDDGNPIEFPILLNESSFEISDIAAPVENASNLWGPGRRSGMDPSDPSGTYETLVDGTLGFGTIPVDPSEDGQTWESNWFRSEDDSYYTFMLLDEYEDYQDAEEDNPCEDWFGPMDDSYMHRIRKIDVYREGGYRKSEQTIFKDDRFYRDKCTFLRTKNNSSEDLNYGTRFKYEIYIDAYTLIHQNVDYGYKPLIDKYEVEFDELHPCRYKTYMRESIVDVHPPENYLTEAFAVIDDPVIFRNRFIEKKLPWETPVIRPDYEDWGDIMGSVYNYLGNFLWYHPDYDEMDIYFGGTPDDEYINETLKYDIPTNRNYVWAQNNQISFDNTIPYYSQYWNEAQDQFLTFSEEKISSDQYEIIGECSSELTGLPAFVEKTHYGTEGCNIFNCTPCKTDSDSGEMYDLHNEHRTSMGLDALIASSVIAEIALEFAGKISRGDAPYSHDGFDDRDAEMLSAEWCIDRPSGENLNRVDLINSTPIETCFQEWLDSPGHRSNIENSEFKMMGYGSVGEYHVVIFAGIKDECDDDDDDEDDPVKACTSVMSVTDETIAIAKRNMGIDSSESFPWEEYQPDEIPNGLSNYIPLGPLPFGPTLIQPVIAYLADTIIENSYKIYGTSVQIGSPGYRVYSVHEKIQVLGSFNYPQEEDDNSMPFIFNIVIGLPFGNEPMRYFTTDRQNNYDDEISEAVYVHASAEIGEDVNGSMAPSEMDRNENLEQAIKDLLKFRYENSSSLDNKNFSNVSAVLYEGI